MLASNFCLDGSRRAQEAETGHRSLPAAFARRDRDCLILDDPGYASKDQAETSALFELIVARDERRSLIVACNQPFSQWHRIFPDVAMTVAAIDRLAHHATILEFNTGSDRGRTAAGAAVIGASLS